MELDDIKPDEKLIKFRKSYREKIDGWYNGPLHVAIIYLIGGLLLYYYITSLNSIVPLELIIIPITFIVSNIYFIIINYFCFYKICIK